jgi:hypothetical protein
LFVIASLLRLSFFCLRIELLLDAGPPFRSISEQRTRNASPPREIHSGRENKSKVAREYFWRFQGRVLVHGGALARWVAGDE